MGLTERFQHLREAREQRKQELAAVRGELKVVQQQLAELQGEVKALGVESLEELKQKLDELEARIKARLEELEGLVNGQ